MDIVDAQLHFGPVGKNIFSPGPLEASPSIIESTLDAMDSVGIQSAVIDEYWYWVQPPKPMQNMPGFELPNGAWRAIFPLAQLAATLHPDRFCAFVRVDRKDPELSAVMQLLASTPHVRAFRMLAAWNAEEAASFMNGGYEPAFEIAQDLGLPMCLAIPGYVEYLPRYLKQFPKLQFVVDHWGMGMNYNIIGRPDEELRKTLSLDYLDEIMKLADYPNVVLKISHAHMFFNAPEYPFEPIRPILRRAIQTFEASRLLWSSDRTVAQPAISWSDLVHYIKDDPELSREEKELILGKNSRRIYNWPKPS
jgi:predicted TIM-barrel fold metal-dependent hydrolase